MSDWNLDAAYKIKEEAETFVDNYAMEGWEYKIEEIGGITGAWWGVYRRESQ